MTPSPEGPTLASSPGGQGLSVQTWGHIPSTANLILKHSSYLCAGNSALNIECQTKGNNSLVIIYLKFLE